MIKAEDDADVNSEAELIAGGKAGKIAVGQFVEESSGE